MNNYSVSFVVFAITACNFDNATNQNRDLGLMDLNQNMAPYSRRLDVYVGSYPRHLIASDIDGDGIKDLLVVRANSNGTIVLLRGRPAGGFGLLSESPAGDTPYAVAVADLDADQKLDAVTVNYLGQDGSVLWGSGPGMFMDRVSLDTGSHPLALALADLNRDGKLDIVAANQVAKSVSVLNNLGMRSFAPKISYLLAGVPGGMAVADINNDQQPDIAVTAIDLNQVRILLSKNGSLSQDQFIDLPVGQLPGAVALGKLNQDQIGDVAVTNQGDNTVSVLLSQSIDMGTPYYASAMTYAVGQMPVSVALGDLNRDGFADIVTANRDGNSVSLLYGQSDGTFKADGTLMVGAKPSAVVLDDLDGDGALDIAATNYGANTVTILYGQR